MITGHASLEVSWRLAGDCGWVDVNFHRAITWPVSVPARRQRVRPITSVYSLVRVFDVEQRKLSKTWMAYGGVFSRARLETRRSSPWPVPLDPMTVVTQRDRRSTNVPGYPSYLAKRTRPETFDVPGNDFDVSTVPSTAAVSNRLAAIGRQPIEMRVYHDGWRREFEPGDD